MSQYKVRWQRNDYPRWQLVCHRPEGVGSWGVVGQTFRQLVRNLIHAKRKRHI